MNAEANEAGMPKLNQEATMDAELLNYIAERSNNISKYSDKLSRSIEEIDQYFRRVGPISGLHFIEDRTFYIDETRKYSLAVTVSDAVWGLKVAFYDFEESDALYTSLKPATYLGRFMKTRIIINLPQFIASYAAELERLEKEYEDISRKAEKMAEILKEVA